MDRCSLINQGTTDIWFCREYWELSLYFSDFSNFIWCNKQECWTWKRRISETPYLRQPKILFVRDSVSSAVNVREAEKCTRTRIRPVNAVSTDSKHNFENVVKHHLDNPGREDYRMLVLSAPSDDITAIVDEKTMSKSWELQKHPFPPKRILTKS